MSNLCADYYSLIKHRHAPVAIQLEALLRSAQQIIAHSNYELWETFTAALSFSQSVGGIERQRLSGDFAALIRMPFALYAEDHLDTALCAIWAVPPE